jgi:hypothetical protein
MSLGLESVVGVLDLPMSDIPDTPFSDTSVHMAVDPSPSQ